MMIALSTWWHRSIVVMASPACWGAVAAALWTAISGSTFERQSCLNLWWHRLVALWVWCSLLQSEQQSIPHTLWSIGCSKISYLRCFDVENAWWSKGNIPTVVLAPTASVGYAGVDWPTVTRSSTSPSKHPIQVSWDLAVNPCGWHSFHFVSWCIRMHHIGSVTTAMAVVFVE